MARINIKGISEIQKISKHSPFDPRSISKGNIPYHWNNLKQIKYIQADIVINMQDKTLEEGDKLFDLIVSTSTIPLIIRHNHTYKWKKYYHYPLDDGVSLDRVLDKTPLTPLSDSIELIIKLKDDKDKQCYVDVTIDLANKQIKYIYLWKYTQPIKEINHQIVMCLNIDPIVDVNITNVIVELDMIDTNFQYYILAEIITNDDELVHIYRVWESYAPLSLKKKFTIRTEYGGLIINHHDKTSIVTSDKISDLNKLYKLISLFDNLLDRYKLEKDRIQKIYAKYLQTCDMEVNSSGVNSSGVNSSGVITGSLTETHKTTDITKLRQEIPELFIKNYSRLCPARIFIVSSEEAQELHAQGRPTMIYPKDGPYSRIYACPIGYYPGLKTNTLPNKDKFEYLPICYLTDHSRKEKSNYNKYYSTGSLRNPTISSMNSSSHNPHSPLIKRMVNRLSTLPSPGTKIALPRMLSKLFGTDNLMRLCIDSNKSSLLTCILFSLKHISTPFDPKYIDYVRKNLKFHPEVCRQEMPEHNNDEIYNIVTNPNLFMDPDIVYRALEIVFNINLYVFNIYKSRCELSMPRNNRQILWRHSIGFKSIIIICNRHIQPHPICELVIRREESTNGVPKMDYSIAIKNIIQYKSNVTNTNKGSVPLLLSGEIAKYQLLNNDGKCIKIITNSRQLPCYTRPYNLPSVELQLGRDITIAYFINDLYQLIGEENIIVTQNSHNTFTPQIMKYRFQNKQECINYYQTNYPYLFKDDKLLVTQEMLDKLKGSKGYLFNNRITHKNFSYHMYNRILIE